MTPPITPPVTLPPLDLERCRKEPLWCKKEIAKRLMLLLLEYTRSKPLPFINHIEANAPGPTRPPVPTPPLEEETPLYSGTGDGFVRRHNEATWALARDNPTGDGSTDTSQYYDNAAVAYLLIGRFYVFRSWLDFDLSSLNPGDTVDSAVLTLTRRGVKQTEICIQQGTQTLPLDNTDFQAFTGAYFSKEAMTSSQVDFTFNAAGRAYLESVLGATAKFCIREYTFDYLDVQPTDQIHGAGIYYRESPTESNRPLLTVTTS